MKKSILFPILFLASLEIAADVMPSRTELSLNGQWEFTPTGGKTTRITVPDYWDAAPGFTDCKQAIYQKKVTIPDSREWKDKRLILEFEGVNFIADVFVDDARVGSHIGAWVPFQLDISDYVSAGEDFTLRVDVKGGSFEPIVDKKGAPRWPVGFIGQKQRWGIVFDVWLRAYGQVSVRDAFIQTSWRDKQIRIDYLVKNSTDQRKTVYLEGKICPDNYPDHCAKAFQSAEIILNPGEERILPLIEDWGDPELWSPAHPFLYYLETSLFSGNEPEGSEKVLDRQKNRFGFREIWVEGNKLMFNGHRFNMLGTNIVQHSEYHDTQRYHYMSRESWNRSIDRLFELNLRTVRFHMQPAPGFILDIADERGLLVIDESTIYAREYCLESDKEEYLKNSKTWIGPWIKARRNHPSVVVWNAENEMGVGWINWLTPEELKSLGDEIRKYDTTRPVNYDGDRDVGDAMVNYHYPEGYMDQVDTSIYAWKDMVFPDKPTGVGEFITHYGPKGHLNQWWMGTWVRGMRYVDFSDIRPYRHDWAWLRSDNTPEIDNLKNGFAPVALFDLEYDDLGLDPLLNANYPILKPGEQVTRKLVIYNDEFEDSLVNIEVVIKSSNMYQALYNYNGDRTPKQEIVASGSRNYIVPLGEHVTIEYSFQVPRVMEWRKDYFDIELCTRKKGNLKFIESKRFQINGNEFSGKSSPLVVLTDPVICD